MGLFEGFLGGISGASNAVSQISQEKRKALAEKLKADLEMQQKRDFRQEGWDREEGLLKQEWAREDTKQGVKQVQEDLQGEESRNWEKEKMGLQHKNALALARIKGDKTGKETVTDKKYQESQAFQRAAMELRSMGLDIAEDEQTGLMTVTIPSDKSGQVTEEGKQAMKAIDMAGLQFKTGKPKMTKDRWGWNNDYGIDIIIGGVKPGGGILGGGDMDETKKEGAPSSAFDDYYNRATKGQPQSPNQPGSGVLPSSGGQAKTGETPDTPSKDNRMTVGEVINAVGSSVFTKPNKDQLRSDIRRQFGLSKEADIDTVTIDAESIKQLWENAKKEGLATANLYRDIYMAFVGQPFSDLVGGIADVKTPFKKR